jgi:hypothetical protein
MELPANQPDTAEDSSLSGKSLPKKAAIQRLSTTAQIFGDDSNKSEFDSGNEEETECSNACHCSVLWFCMGVKLGVWTEERSSDWSCITCAPRQVECE